MQMGWLIALSLWGCTLLLGEPGMATRSRTNRVKQATTGSAGPAARPGDQQAELGGSEASLRLPRWGAGYPSFARAGTTWETPRMSCLRSGSTARTSAHSWPPSSRSEAHSSPTPHSLEAPGSGWAADTPEKCSPQHLPAWSHHTWDLGRKITSPRVGSPGWRPPWGGKGAVPWGWE